MLRRVNFAGLATCWLILTFCFSQTVNAGSLSRVTTGYIVATGALTKQFNNCCCTGLGVGFNGGYNWLSWNNNMLAMEDTSFPITLPRTLSCTRTQETRTVRSRNGDTRQITITRC
jgi:hypothetical protein